MADIGNNIEQTVKITTEFDSAKGLSQLSKEIKQTVSSSVREGLKSIGSHISEGTKQAYRDSRALAVGTGESSHAMKQLRSSLSAQAALEQQVKQDRSRQTALELDSLKKKAKELTIELESAKAAYEVASEKITQYTDNINKAENKIKGFKTEIKKLKEHLGADKSFEKQAEEINKLEVALDQLARKKQALVSDPRHKQYADLVDGGKVLLEDEARRIRSALTSNKNKLSGLYKAKEKLITDNNIDPTLNSAQQIEQLGLKSTEAKARLEELTKQILLYEKSVQKMSDYSKGFTAFKNAALTNETQTRRKSAQLAELQAQRAKLTNSPEFEQDRAKLAELEQQLKQTTLALEGYKQAKNKEQAKITTYGNEIDQLQKEQQQKQQDLLKRREAIAGAKLDLEAQRALNAEMMRAQDIRRNTTNIVSQQVKAYISFTLGLSSLIRMVRQSFRFIVDLDRALTEISTTTKKSTEETLALAESYNKMGQEMGKSTAEIAKASAIFFRQGKSDTEVASLMKSVIMGAALEGTSIEETAGRATAALNAYKLGASEAQNVMSKFAAVGAAAATDFGKLSYALTKVGAGANLAGVSMDHLLGILATTLDVLQEA